MMNLRSMVVGLESDHVANGFMRCWEHDEGTLKFWRASSNFVYVFTHHKKRYFLRFSFELDNTVEQISAELDFMVYLGQHGYASVSPIRSINGKLIETVKTNEGTYYAVVFTEAAGRPLDMEEMTDVQFESWGQSLACLHRLSRTYLPAGEIRKDCMDILADIGLILQRYPLEQEALAELDRIKSWLDSLGRSDEDFGLIHYDFQMDNVFWDEKACLFNVFDFDDAMYHWFAMDIVSALADLFDEDGQSSGDKLACFLKGYRSTLPLSDDTVAQFPKFFRFDRLYGFSRLLYALENCDIDDAPPWYDPLIFKLTRICEERRQGFRKPW
jgi:Ser/Thr protein kinase RdoA (MazF antagonist)